MKKFFSLFSLWIALLLLLSACNFQAGTATSSSRVATVTEIVNDIQMRSSAKDAFVPASIGQILAVGGELKSGADSKASLTLQPENTVVYVGPDSLFTMNDISTKDGNPFTRLKLELGKLWVVLNGGSLEVETPSGVASVRGSLMTVVYGSDGSLTIGCLEGHCDYNNNGTTINLTGGLACDLVPGTDECQTRPITEQEQQDWQNNVPGSGDSNPPTETFTLVPTDTPTPVPTPTPQPMSGASGNSGPDIGDFPGGINPLTGLPVSDPYMLTLPAVLIAIPHFPPSARPPAGLSYAPWVFETYIGEGMTRFLASFYGEEPAVKPYLTGSCEVRTTPFVPQGTVLGNRAWWDENGNGVQDPNEQGIAGVCVTLYDAAGNSLQTTSTDSNGYYGFNVDAGGSYIIGFEKPTGLDFTTPHTGYDEFDSDADPATGLTPVLTAAATDMNWDGGYVQIATGEPTPTLVPGEPTPTPVQGGGITELPPAEIGPIRSMRLSFWTVGHYFQDGCIVAASGSPDVLSKVHMCDLVFNEDPNNINGAVLDITDLRNLAEKNKNPNHPINYSGNVFSTTPPPGGQPASQLDVFWNDQDQARYIFDALSGAYGRNANLPDAEDTFTPQTDRLNGHQLLYSNVIVIYVEHTVYSQTKMDLNLDYNMGRAFLFRDGQMYPIYWSTMSREYEKTTGYLRPMFFTDKAGNPFPLKPGHTWVNIFTPGSSVYEQTPGSGLWTAYFSMP